MNTHKKYLAKIIAIAMASILVCLFCVPGIEPLAKDTFTSRFTQTIYNQNNGIGSNEVNCIYQSSSGYIWVGTDGGLYRSSGSDFKSISLWDTDRADIYSINCIMQDSKGRMWIGTDNYGLFIIEDGNNYHFQNEYYNGIKSIKDFCETLDGHIYVATSNGLFTFVDESTDSEKYYSLEFYKDDSIAQKVFYDIENFNDKVWGISEDSNVYGWDNNMVTNIFDASGIVSEELSCLRTIDDKIYVGTKGREIICFDKKMNHEVLSCSIEGINRITTDVNGYIWVCTDNGIGHFNKKGTFIVNYDFEIDNYLSDMIQDYEGNYWIASTRMGLLLLNRSKFIDYNMYAGLQTDMVNCVFEYKQKKYIGTDEGLTILDANEKKITNSLTEMLDGVSVRQVINDDEGNLWISTYRRYGIIKYSKSGEIINVNRIGGLVSNSVNCALILSGGNIAVGTSSGVSVLDKNGVVIASYGVNDGLAYSNVLCLYQNTSGEILAGTDGGGIYVINMASGGDITNYTVEQGLNSNVIADFEPASEGLWIATDNGLCFYNDTFRAISNIEYSNSIYDIVKRNGSIWLISSRGVLHTTEEELLGSEGVAGRYFDVNDGLIRNINSVSSSFINEDGKLYICCNDGILLLETDNIPYNLVQPRIKVTNIDIDGVRYEFDNLSDGIKLKSNVSRITIGFAVFSFNNRENINVEYYLKGFDSDSIQINGDDAMEAVYTNLDGGVYQFEISAKNGDGTECGESVSFVIEKEKRFMENQFARISVICFIIAGFALLIALLIYVRKILNNKDAAIESLSKEHEEAVKSSSAKNDYLAKISNDIKIPINAIMVKAEEALQGMDSESPYSESVKSIYDIGSDIVNKIDDIILLAKIEAGRVTMHEDAYSITTLMYSLSEFAMNKIGDKGVRFFVEIGENIIDNVIGDEEKIKEILTRLLENAIKYTKEGSITMSVDSYEYVDKYNNDMINIVFTISDTGVGIHSDRVDKIFEVYNIADNIKNKAHAGSGVGLAIAKGYTDIIDGDIEVESVYGAGSTFTLSISQKIATGVGKSQPITKIENMLSKEMTDKMWLPDVHALLVDDEEVSREVEIKTLSTFEMKLDVASSGINAIDMVMNNSYDVVFIDLSMPIMNGSEVMKEIRELDGDKYAMLPIISMDVDAIEANTAQLISDGFTDNIVKPIDARRVAAILKDCLPISKIKEKSSDIVQYIENSNYGEGLKRLKPQVEVERAIEKIGGSIDVYNKLITAYYKQNILDVDELHDKFEKDIRGFKTRIHSIRTFSVNIGAYKFARETAVIEAAVNKRNKDYVRHNIRKFSDHLHELLLLIEEYIEYMEDYKGETEEEHAKKNAKEYSTDKTGAIESNESDIAKSDLNKVEIEEDDAKDVEIENATLDEEIDEVEFDVADSSEVAVENYELINADALKQIQTSAVEGDYDTINIIIEQLEQYDYAVDDKDFLNVLKENISNKNIEGINELVATYIELKWSNDVK